VDPRGRLTLQQHPGRDETWVIVAGTATVERDGVRHELAAGQSITVPRGVSHRLSNPGAEPLRLIEIGQGEALGDEDTVRLAD
ncbi:MAG: phosphomannose isomerase type II C-terminal cupin domain, partial [Geminicoccaceae bacterium]